MTVTETPGTETRVLSGDMNGQIWGARAADWASIQEAQCAAGYHAVLDKASVGSTTCLLDAGCGAGMAMQLAAELGADVSGIDASAGLLAVARDRLPNARFEHGDLEILPFEDDSFDVVTGFNAFQFAAAPVAALPTNGGSRRGKVFPIYAAAGGVGASTLAVNLAWETPP